MSEQQRQNEDTGGAHAPGAGPPPARLNPTAPPPKLNFLAVLLVGALVVGAAGLGLTAVSADRKRQTEAKEKIAAQKASDARREGGSEEALLWRGWADATCQSVVDRSRSLGALLEAVDLAKDPQQVVVFLGDAFVTLADLYRAWGAGMAATPAPALQQAGDQVGLYVTYLSNVADQAQRFADSLKGLDPGTVTSTQIDELLEEAGAIDRTLVDLPEAGAVYRAIDGAPVCQDVTRQVETKV